MNKTNKTNLSHKTHKIKFYVIAYLEN